MGEFSVTDKDALGRRVPICTFTLDQRRIFSVVWIDIPRS